MEAGEIVPAILCGGAGTRLWPASRESRPKQFIPLAGALSPFQNAVLMVSGHKLFGRPIVVCGVEHRFLVADQLRAIGIEADILLEPVRRDSGPAIAVASHFARLRDPGAVVLSLAADHLVRFPDVFTTACEAALAATGRGYIVMFGVTPDGPATGYGYIRPGQALDGSRLRAVAAFVEKPDAASAARYVAEGCLWNVGNFLFAADTLLEEYAELEPENAEHARKAVAGRETEFGFHLLAREPYAAISAGSIDRAVMERTKRAAVMPVSHGWSDLGTWETVWAIADKDVRGNVARGPAALVESDNCLVISDRPLVALAGMSDLVVVADEDAILVARRNDADAVRSMVAHLHDKGHGQAVGHARCYRPWGFYQLLNSGDGFQVKRIVVRPGGQLSLQRHVHRAEHWVVVRGIGEVLIGNEVTSIGESQSGHIPAGVLHRLRNPGEIDLELIEVQTGSYLGEDDIERLEDAYGR